MVPGHARGFVLTSDGPRDVGKSAAHFGGWEIHVRDRPLTQSLCIAVAAGSG